MLEPHTLFFQKFNTRQLLRPFGNSSVVSMILIRLAFSFALLRTGRQAAAYSRLAALAWKLPGGGPAVAAGNPPHGELRRLRRTRPRLSNKTGDGIGDWPAAPRRLPHVKAGGADGAEERSVRGGAREQ